MAPHACAAELLLFLGMYNPAPADTPPGAGIVASDTVPDEAPKSLPQENFFSSVKQSLRLGYDHEAVRGHFDQGSPPNSHRYYCLVDTKTHAREPNGVLGQPVPLADGTTALKVDSVSLYSCAKAEQAGILITAGYFLKAPTAAAAAAQPLSQPAAPAAPAAQAAPPPPVPSAASPMPVPVPVPVPVQAPVPVSGTAPAASPFDATPDKIDVAGVKLGMSLDEVRGVLKAKKLREYNESTETLSYLDAASGVMHAIAGSRFVSVIAAWSPPAGADNFQASGESYQVMFTPIPGKERVLAIVHSVGYAPPDAIRETALENGLIRKYGGFGEANPLPDSPTWRFQSNGHVQVGDPCNRRGVIGGLGGLTAANPAPANLALKQSADELRFQIDHCGAAIVTEDHFTANGGAVHEERIVTRFTVSAYSPSIALGGSTEASQLVRAAKSTLAKPDASRAKEQPAPNL